MIRCSHGQTAFCSYVLDQMALHVYLQKVICGKNETSLVHVRFLSGIGSGSIAIFKHKNVHTMHFLFVFKLLFKKKGRGNFWRPQFARKCIYYISLCLSPHFFPFFLPLQICTFAYPSPPPPPLLPQNNYTHRHPFRYFWSCGRITCN